MAYRGLGVKKAKPMFQRVLDCFDSQAEFARQVGQSRAVVGYWVKCGVIPPMHALESSLATGGKVSVQELIQEAHREKLRKRGVREAKRAARELESMEAIVAAEGGS